LAAGCVCVAGMDNYRKINISRISLICQFFLLSFY